MFMNFLSVILSAFYDMFKMVWLTFELALIYQDHQSKDVLKPYGKKFSGLVREQPSVTTDLLRIDPYFLYVGSLAFLSIWGKLF